MSEQAPTQKRAVIHTRRSSKRQLLSLARQMAVIGNYAKRRGLEVVMACFDGGKGGGKA